MSYGDTDIERTLRRAARARRAAEQNFRAALQEAYDADFSNARIAAATDETRDCVRIRRRRDERRAAAA